jgi:uroporphyrinogen-III synthase
MNPRADLTGRTILVTRAAAQAAELLRAIEARGGTPLLFPMIEIAPPLSWERCDDAIARIGRFDGLVFASANGVEGFFHRLAARGVPAGNLAGTPAYAVGQRTKDAVERHGLDVRAVPERFTAADLVETLKGLDLAGQRFLFPRGNLGSATLADGLAAQGALVETVEVYRTIEPEHADVARISERLKSRQVDIITFASPSSARHFAALVAPEAMRTVALAAIGPATAAAVTELGFVPAVVAPQSSMESLLDAIAEYFQHNGTPSSTTANT